MPLTKRLVNWFFRILLGMLCRIDGKELAKLPPNGPLIVVSNHINILEVAILFTHVMPRRVSGYAKAETWDSPFYAPLFDIWEAVPIRRGELDMNAVRGALDMLNQGVIFGIAPEGTRTHDGRLIRGKPGVVTLALRSGAPIQVVANFGHENFAQDWKRLRRAPIKFSVGPIFYLDPRGERVNGEMRQQMTDEIMYQIATLLPEKYRGVYADLDNASTKYLRFVEVPEIVPETSA